MTIQRARRTCAACTRRGNTEDMTEDMTKALLAAV